MTRATWILVGWLGLAGAILVPLSGAIPIEASSGHWRVTAFVLDLVKRRSVDTYSWTVTPPTHELPSWVARGAAHFESGCRTCHGSPISPRPPMVMRMTPHPPELPARIARWEPRELFQIVRHGIKFTAMPAWTAPQRPDEVWAMVAFVRALPGMSAETYRGLAFGTGTSYVGPGLQTRPGAELAIRSCARCHGDDGMGRGGLFPVLAGQHPEYLRNALIAYRDDKRHSGFMRSEASELDESAREVVVNYFSELPRPLVPPAAEGLGAFLVASGDPRRQVPACSQCHGPSATDRNPAYPVLAGQDPDYLFEQLVLFSENRRGGSPFAPIMQAVATRLSRDQMRQAAEYYGSFRRN